MLVYKYNNKIIMMQILAKGLKATKAKQGGSKKPNL